MKSNPTLQRSIGFANAAQRVWYAAHVLKAALTNSPAIPIRLAKRAVAAKPEVLAQTAKPARAATAAVLAEDNTVGYAFGELYLNSPAYPVGTAIPAIPAKPASPAVIAQAAIVGQPAVTAVTSPAVASLPGWENAISITKTAELCTVTFKLPVAAGVGIVGSNFFKLGQITPANLQATTWLDDSVGDFDLGDNTPSDSLEEYLYKNALLCEHTIDDVLHDIHGTLIKCKQVTVNLYPRDYLNQITADTEVFNPLLDSLQLRNIYTTSALVIVPPTNLATLIANNTRYASEWRASSTDPAWIANVDALTAEPLWGQYVVGGLWLSAFDSGEGYPNFENGIGLYSMQGEYGVSPNILTVFEMTP